MTTKGSGQRQVQSSQQIPFGDDNEKSRCRDPKATARI
jgi:hypothetical protein